MKVDPAKSRPHIVVSAAPGAALAQAGALLVAAAGSAAACHPGQPQLVDQLVGDGGQVPAPLCVEGLEPRRHGLRSTAAATAAALR